MNNKLLFSIPNYYLKVAKEFFIKKNALKDCRDDIHSLILGCSHADCTFNTDIMDGFFNLAFKSQDLFYSYSLYEKYHPLLKKLKDVYLVYSPFFPGWELFKSVHYHYCFFYKIIYGLSYPNKSLLFSLKEPYYRRKLQKIEESLSPAEHHAYKTGFLNYMNYNEERPSDMKTVVSQIKECVRSEKTTEYVRSLYAQTKSNGHSLTLVLPPFSHFYRTMMPDVKILFREVDKLVKDYDIKVLDFYGEDYPNDLFLNIDHLNLKGATHFVYQFYNRLEAD